MNKPKGEKKKLCNFRLPEKLLKKMDAEIRKAQGTYISRTHFIILACESLIWELNNKRKV